MTDGNYGGKGLVGMAGWSGRGLTPKFRRILLLWLCLGTLSGLTAQDSAGAKGSGLTGVAENRGQTSPGTSPAPEEAGTISWYADKFQGRPTASGELFDQNKLTAAHKRLAFGTRVKVTNTANGRSVVVVINDRGPFITGRILDLSRAAAEIIGLTDLGVAPAVLQVLDSGGLVTATEATPVPAPSPTPPTPPARQPAAGLVPAAGRPVYQIGAYRSLENARKRAAESTAKGFETGIRQDETVFRVFVMGRENQDSPSLGQALERAGFREAQARQTPPPGQDVE